ncbi:rRNA maturation RNase YbeY [Aerococcaceae bacterium WGS1372]
MIIDLIDENNYLTEEHNDIIEKVIQQTANKLSLGEDIEVDISIVDNDVIQQLNRDYRGIDKPTDVLSFALEEDLDDAPSLDFDQFADIISPMEEGENLNNGQMIGVARHLGDIIISFQRTKEQAIDYNHSFERELAFLAVHGFLHLNGYDHMTKEDEEVMFTLQEEVLSENGFSR